jgi:hypothetical protein
LLEERVGIVSCLLGLGECDGKGVPAGFAEEVVGLCGEGAFEGVGVAVADGNGELAALRAHRVHGGGGSSPIRGPQVLGGLPGGSGLLGVSAGGVPADGGEGDEDHGRHKHRGSAAVLALTQGIAGTDDAARSGP